MSISKDLLIARMVMEEDGADAADQRRLDILQKAWNHVCERLDGEDVPWSAEEVVADPGAYAALARRIANLVPPR